MRRSVSLHQAVDFINDRAAFISNSSLKVLNTMDFTLNMIWTLH